MRNIFSEQAWQLVWVRTVHIVSETKPLSRHVNESITYLPSLLRVGLRNQASEQACQFLYI